MDNDCKYYAMIPHMVDDMDITPNAYRLYGHIKRVVGESPNGLCFQSERTMAAWTHMSQPEVNNCKKELASMKLITIEIIRDGMNRKTHIIKVVNIWIDNIRAYHLVKEPIDSMVIDTDSQV